MRPKVTVSEEQVPPAIFFKWRPGRLVCAVTSLQLTGNGMLVRDCFARLCCRWAVAGNETRVFAKTKQKTKETH